MYEEIQLFENGEQYVATTEIHEATASTPEDALRKAADLIEEERRETITPTFFDEGRWVSRNPDVTKEAIGHDTRPHQVLQILVENGATEGGLTNEEIATLSNDDTLSAIRAGAGSNPLSLNGFADRVEDSKPYYYRVCEKGLRRYKQLGQHPDEVESTNVLSA